MIINSPLWNQITSIIGEIIILVIIVAVVSAVILTFIAAWSIRSGSLPYPRLMASGMMMLEGLIKSFCRLLGIDDTEIVSFFIRIHNAMNARKFEQVPLEKRAVFLPQCLRSTECPADLTPEGLICKHCGRCPVGQAIDIMQSAGCRVFLVPGSTVIRRMVRKYKPEAIIGVGCLIEVKEGLEMTDKMGITGMGVVTLYDGCVETAVDWHNVFDVVFMGYPDLLHGLNLNIPSN
ncbi:MAG: DUF116 domain-containing protein [Methanoculleaceae archaeon]